MNIAVLGSKGLAKELGKAGTKSDIALYNTVFQGKILTFIEPLTYPEKISSLFQALNMSHLAILHISKGIEKIVLGECILALDMLRKQGMIFLDGVNADEIMPLIKDTVLQNYKIVNDAREILPEIMNFSLEKIGSPAKIVIDHSFVVKSVGLVVLGTVMSGEVKKYDKLVISPAKKEAMIKSIQINDKDVDKAECFDRVGLALKGIELEDVERGSILAANALTVKKLENASISKSKIWKDDLPENVMCIVGLQYVPAKLSNASIEFSKEIAFDNEKIIILTPDKKIRIAGFATKS